MLLLQRCDNESAPSQTTGTNPYSSTVSLWMSSADNDGDLPINGHLTMFSLTLSSAPSKTEDVGTRNLCAVVGPQSAHRIAGHCSFRRCSVSPSEWETARCKAANSVLSVHDKRSSGSTYQSPYVASGYNLSTSFSSSLLCKVTSTLLLDPGCASSQAAENLFGRTKTDLTHHIVARPTVIIRHTSIPSCMVKCL